MFVNSFENAVIAVTWTFSKGKFLQLIFSKGQIYESSSTLMDQFLHPFFFRIKISYPYRAHEFSTTFIFLDFLKCLAMKPWYSAIPSKVQMYFCIATTNLVFREIRTFLAACLQNSVDTHTRDLRFSTILSFPAVPDQAHERFGKMSRHDNLVQFVLETRHLCVTVYSTWQVEQGRRPYLMAFSMMFSS